MAEDDAIRKNLSKLFVEVRRKVDRIPEDMYALRGVKIEQGRCHKLDLTGRPRFNAYFAVRSGSHKGCWVLYPFKLPEFGQPIRSSSNFYKLIAAVFGKSPLELNAQYGGLDLARLLADLEQRFVGFRCIARVETITTDWNKNKKPLKDRYSRVSQFVPLNVINEIEQALELSAL